MLKKTNGSDETLVHICRSGRGKPEVFLHDIKAYMLIDRKVVCIKYCPYCGQEIEKDKEVE